MIAVIDYGMGNIHSVRKALEVKGAKVKVTSLASDIESCQKLVLPGVGAFADAMQELAKLGLVSLLQSQIKLGKPFLGICLGMQLLFEKSSEAKGVAGLGILKGSVELLDRKRSKKVPQIGWNQLKFAPGECPLLQGLEDNSYVYFCHSYYPKPADKGCIAATTDYGVDFASCICKDNIYGVQFHPEKSQGVGLKIVENFIKLC
ncbi:imidazole glycerol phosphate synthase subunit HisH [Candidatus Omnitrophota bacterium]